MIFKRQENGAIESYRQGDVLVLRLEETAECGNQCSAPGEVILALGEVTGHAHRITSEEVALFDIPKELDKLLTTGKTAKQLRHEEHGTIELPASDFIVRRQREYLPEGESYVID